MFKKISLFMICISMSLFLAACGGAQKKELVSLNEDEEELLELVGEDMQVITDDDYAQTVSELVYHGSEFSGQVYQLEGVYAVEDGAPSVSRTLVAGNEKTACGLPLKYMQKEIEAGSWVKVSGVVSLDEADGADKTVLEVLAIETLPKSGKAELPWENSSDHQH